MIKRAQKFGVGAGVLAAVGVGVVIAGPLQPPAGPVTDTDPDLGQILTAVQGAGGSSCGKAPALAGLDSSAQMTIAGLGTFDVLEFTLGAQAMFQSGGGGGAFTSAARDITVTRVFDRWSPELFRALVTGQQFTDARIEQGSPQARFEFEDVRLVSIENVIVSTCDGPISAERVTFQAPIVSYTDPVSGSNWAWDFNFQQVP
jgi:type VI protein secretion system component Hcp